MQPSLLLALLIFAAQALAAEPVKLEPKATLRFEFPELPETLRSMFTGEKKPAMLTATLPANYTADGKFPLFVYLRGNQGTSEEDAGREEGRGGHQWNK